MRTRTYPGKAKAMIVTRSRLHAVRYRLALERGYPYEAMVAFSGTVTDPDDDMKYTEAQMNSVPETQTASTFEQAQYRFLIVADKYQTGFDEPLLTAMYVDKQPINPKARSFSPTPRGALQASPDGQATPVQPRGNRPRRPGPSRRTRTHSRRSRHRAPPPYEPSRP
jgi:hypothetical protein